MAGKRQSKVSTLVNLDFIAHFLKCRVKMSLPFPVKRVYLSNPCNNGLSMMI